jgi:hypothetical protein
LFSYFGDVDNVDPSQAMDEKASAPNDLSLFVWCQHIAKVWHPFGSMDLCTHALEGRSMIEGLRPPMLVQSILENITKDRQNMGRANQVVVHVPHAKVET